MPMSTRKGAMIPWFISGVAPSACLQTGIKKGLQKTASASLFLR